MECLKSNIENYSIPIKHYKKDIEELEGCCDDLKNKLEKRADEGVQAILNTMYCELDGMRLVIKENEKLDPEMIKKYQQKSKSIYMDSDKIVRYTMNVSLGMNPTSNEKVFNEICEQWKEKFIYPLSWRVMDLGGKITYQIIIRTPDPRDIAEYSDDLMKDIYRLVYSSKKK